MSYSPAPLALDRAKPSPWNVEQAFVAPEYQPWWKSPGFAGPLWEGSGAPVDYGTRRFANTSSGSWQPSSLGVGYSLTATSEHLWWDPHPSYEFGGDIEFTIWVAVNITGSDGSFPGLFSHRTSNDAGMWELFFSQSNGWIRFSYRDLTNQHNIQWDGAWPGTGFHTFVMTRRRGGVYELWIDGVSEGAQSDSNTAVAASHRLVIGGLQADLAGERVFGTYLTAGFVRHAVSDRQARQFNDDPHGLFRPNWDYVTAAAFSSTSLYATADGTIADVVNENDAATPLSPSVDDDPASPSDSDWINNAVDVT